MKEEWKKRITNGPLVIRANSFPFVKPKRICVNSTAGPSPVLFSGRAFPAPIRFS
jgi:hypothetical protein